MNAPSTTIRKGRKYDDVLEGARRVFMTDGFEGASVDDIARAAGVSKATLYSYFPDKRLLFIEVATTECALQAEKGISDIDMTAPPREVLTRTGKHFLSFILSQLGGQIFRICVAESDRFPEIGQAFYKSGPMLIRDVMIHYFNGAMERGELRMDDPGLAADQFAELCKADLWTKKVFGIQREFAADEITRIVDGAVDTFLARYGV
ncbi:TetR/AcrR family transcriptional regulator [Pseudaestuariivita atlantica]|uniref:TetR family transcriptional regulator n=1 Tax=Pseudaestuariivita atlantica TaxID=1317121 RepID=A0A0L1JN95_9RHOB|nr:TetR/AcrR family transcriptional regulator [Pseudaestuariivita atlantica]KNG93224.1 TetR family transcriptional regulator [Pseudaestuariivita atlantica]